MPSLFMMPYGLNVNGLLWVQMSKIAAVSLEQKCRFRDNNNEVFISRSEVLPPNLQCNGAGGMSSVVRKTLTRWLWKLLYEVVLLSL